MNWWRPFRYRVGALFSKRWLEREMADEIREHLEERAEHYVQSGMSPEEARFAAQRDFGGVDQLKERCRDQRGWMWLESLAKDFRFTVRSLAKSPGFSLAIVGTLALGIGSAVAIYHAVDWVLFRANPFPADIFAVSNTDQSGLRVGCLVDAQIRIYREQSNVFKEWGLSSSPEVNVSIAGSPIATHCLDISPNFFPLLGIAPALGRGFLPGEDVEGKNQVVVISDFFWQVHFAGSPDVLGQKIVVGKMVCTVVGVLKNNQSLLTNFWAEVYRPLVCRVNPAKPETQIVEALVQLQPGVTRAAAESAMAGAKIDWPAHWIAKKQTLIPLAELQKWNHPEIYWILCGAVGFLYAIACLNATNLLLVRQLGRKRELSVRLALGGGRWCIIRQVLIESFCLSLVSCAAGKIVADGLNLLFVALGQNTLQLNGLSWATFVGISWSTFAILAGVALLTSIAIVLVPAAGLWRLDIQKGLKDGGGGIGESRRLARLRGGLVVLQIAFAILLLTGAGLMVRTFQKLNDVRLGFETDHRVKAWLGFPNSYSTGAEAQLAMIKRLQDDLQRVPDVADVAFGTDNLMSENYHPFTSMEMPDGTPVRVEFDTFSANYREVTGVVLKRGQWLDETSQSEVIINETFAARCFGDKDPIGQAVRLAGAPKQWKGWTVAGVVGDMRETLRSAPGYHIYFSPGPWALNISSFILRFAGDSSDSSETAIRQAIFKFDPDIAVYDVIPLAEIRYRGMYNERFALSVLKVLSAIALFLTVVGIFSVVAYTVDTRMNEFGVRLAMGAQPADLYRLVMKRGLLAAAIGIILGIAGALALTRFMQSLLFETTAYDPTVFAAVALLLLTAAAAACWLPARRAGQVDVTNLLRAE
jgi:putative ABC transport system permease protein